ncbi:hypothetical protein [Flagellimonas onchidii]|uniref:hypothetical protein n=1 Tax=Flagellimonas onchidii TaxID=2562684 RepID=UPI0010A61666|nr:hypothetical protein [Allomuricauda onchidii]
MGTERAKFRNVLKELPQEVFDDITSMLSEKYGIDDIEVSNITLKPTANPTQAECNALGKELFCRKYGDGTVRCWCV